MFILCNLCIGGKVDDTGVRDRRGVVIATLESSDMWRRGHLALSGGILLF